MLRHSQFSSILKKTLNLSHSSEVYGKRINQTSSNVLLQCPLRSFHLIASNDCKYTNTKSIRLIDLTRNWSSAFYRSEMSSSFPGSPALSLNINASICCMQPTSSYHSSSIRLAGKGKDKKSKNAKDEGDVTVVTLPAIKDIETNMNGRITRLEEEFKTIRGGKASADMFNHLRIDAFGSKFSLMGSAQVTVQTPVRVNIAVFDHSLVEPINDAIKKQMNLNPSVEGNNIVVTVPKTTNETKEILLKTVSKMADKVTSTQCGKMSTSHSLL